MSSVLPASAGRTTLANQNLSWALALAGFAAMYVPIYWWAAGSIWQTDDHGHGPIILAVLVWLFWGLRHEISASSSEPMPSLGWPVFALGLFFYFVGRVFGIAILELGSQPLVVAGLLLLLSGMSALRLAWFPVVYFVFMVPLPSIGIPHEQE